MEIQFQVQQPASSRTSTDATVPQKRKVGSDEPPEPAGPPRPVRRLSENSEAAEGESPKNEYETGRVTCESCGESISFRDEATGGFTVKHWDLHRQECSNAGQQISVNDAVLYTPEGQGNPTAPQPKRRRAKRTEEERINYLRSDPYVAQFEAYRVLCASCDKWIRLRPNSTYCSIPWDAHRKSCLTKKAAKSAHVSNDRNGLFASDPQVRKSEADRVLCKICETWVPLGTSDDGQALQTWLGHRTQCLQSRPTPGATSASSHNASIPTADSVPPPSKHLMALVSSSSIPASQPPNLAPLSAKGRSETSPASSSVSPAAFKDLNPSNFNPSQESRRRNAEQRAASLRSDPLIGEVEPNRVFCTMCQKWVQLRQDSTYCAYPWQQHREKCLIRREKRALKERELQEYRAQMAQLKLEEDVKMDTESDDMESEEGVNSGNDEGRARKAAKREAKREARHRAELERQRTLEERKAILKQKEEALNHTEDDEDADGEYDMDYEEPVARMTDLDSPSGRLEFISRSVQYLFRTTYEHTDDLTIAALVTYLNAAIPPDKYEDFDTTEVTKAARALHERGEAALEGDVLRAL